MLQISFLPQNHSDQHHSDGETLEKGALAVLVPELVSDNEGHTLTFHGLKKELAESLAQAAKAEEFTGKEDTHCVILAPAPHISRVVLIGIGKKEAFQAWEAEKAGGYAAFLLGKEKTASLILWEISRVFLLKAAV